MYQDPMENHDFLAVASLLRQRPHAFARLTGSRDMPILRGIVRLYPMPRGILLAVEADRLPRGAKFDLHIEGEIPLPSLVSVRGQVLQVMLVGACTVEDLMGRTVSIEREGVVLGKGTVCP